MRQDIYPLNVATAATGIGSAQRVEEMDEKWVQITGTFVATVSIETSADGVTYAQAIVTPPTAPGWYQIPMACKWLRVNVTAYTSGQAGAFVTGFNRRTV